MLGGLLFVVMCRLAVLLSRPDSLYIWVFAFIAMCISFGEPAMRSARLKKD